MLLEEEYRKIGKAVIDECLLRGNETCITITLRSVQFEGKLFIRMEDLVEPLSIWNFSDLIAINMANKTQDARERAEMLPTKIRAASEPEVAPEIVILT